MIFSREHTYTTRSYTQGFGENKGFKVVTKAVGGVAAGQELWFPNASYRQTTGATFPGGNIGDYWASNQYDGSNAYALHFYSSVPTGGLSYGSKLYGFSIRCVR